MERLSAKQQVSLVQLALEIKSSIYLYRSNLTMRVVLGISLLQWPGFEKVVVNWERACVKTIVAIAARVVDGHAG